MQPCSPLKCSATTDEALYHRLTQWRAARTQEVLDQSLDGVSAAGLTRLAKSKSMRYEPGGRSPFSAEAS